MMKYAVTGSTGRFGRTVIKTLLETVPASDIIALARDTEKAADLLPDGIEIRPGEYEDAPRLSDSLQGVNRLLLISSQPGAPMSRPEQHQNVIDAAKDAGVAFIAYTSFPHADTSTAALAADHQATEKALRNSGLAFSFLRNNWYLENDFNVIEAGANGQPVIYSAGQGRVGWTPESDYAQAAAKVLTMDDPKAVYEFAGAPATYADLAKAVSEATGKTFPVANVSDDDYTANLKQAGFDTNTALLFTSFQQLIRDGNLDEESDDLQTVLGRPLLSLKDAVTHLIKK